MMNRIENMKWRLPIFFFISTCITIGVGIEGYIYINHHYELPQAPMWTILAIILALISLFIGYVAATMYQRKLDVLHLAVMQVAKGNLSSRIDVIGTDSFDTVYEDFNDMTDWVEGKMRILQRLGEESVMQQMHSNEAAVLEERKRLARDLHDTVSQQLFAIHMSSASLQKMLISRPEMAAGVVEQLVTMSQHAQKQMRGLIAQLRPLELEDKSLADALDLWFPVYCSQNGLQGKLDLQFHSQFSEALEHQLFLIIQEGMANVVKHAKAIHVSLSLYETDHQYLLQITDDGLGFDQPKTQPTSYGLASMKERAQKLGGSGEVISRSGSGTSVKISIPKFN
jgi:NarL family two-component system sensor histidine kinase LiaS